MTGFDGPEARSGFITGDLPYPTALNGLAHPSQLIQQHRNLKIQSSAGVKKLSVDHQMTMVKTYLPHGCECSGTGRLEDVLPVNA